MFPQKRFFVRTVSTDKEDINIIQVISKTGGSGAGTVVIFFVYPLFLSVFVCFCFVFSLSPNVL